MVNPRSYTPTTIKKLYGYSGDVCTAPSCNNPMISSSEKTIISQICHIEAASEEGARYNSKMTDDERRSYNNLILLCPSCHIFFDKNEYLYTVELLKEWKENHISDLMGRKSNSLSFISY